MKRIKVVHIITRLDRGGSADNTLITVMGLNKRRFKVTLVAGRTTEPTPKLAQLKEQTHIRFLQVPQLVREISPHNDLIAFVKLYRLLKRGRFGIVHTHCSKAGILGRWAARLARAPHIVHTPHGNIFYGYYGKPFTHLFILMERFSARFTDRIITLTNKGREEHLRFKVGLPDKFRTIYSGIDLSSFLGQKKERINVKKELGIPLNHRVVGSVARLVPVKDHFTFIKAAPLIAEAFPQVSFLLVGDGPLRNHVESLAAKLGVSQRMVITGMRDDIPRLLSAMDLVVLTSLNEGMGKSLVEAMAMGRAVVATDVGGVAEVVEDGTTGLLVPPSSPHLLAKAVIDLLRDDEKRGSFGQRGKKRVGKFSAQLMIREIERLYLELTGE